MALDPLAAPEEEEDAVALQQVPPEPAREADLTAKGEGEKNFLINTLNLLHHLQLQGISGVNFGASGLEELHLPLALFYSTKG